MSLPSLISHVNHAAEILESINRIRARHRRETGVTMPRDEAFRLHCESPDPDDIFPDRGVLVPAKCVLLSKGYTDIAVAGAISDIARDGTAQLSLWVDAEDLDEVEEAIPGDPTLWPASTDAAYINLGPNADPIDGAF
jgi:hypothetical protein